MEEKYDEYMKSENSLSMLLSIVAFICIAIAVFGIFSLVTLSCEQRRKEIAIRKVNGASIGTSAFAYHCIMYRFSIRIRHYETLA